MLLKEGKIVPGKCIYPFFIGMTSSELIELLECDYYIEDRVDGIFVLSINNAKFFFNSDKILYQIGVSYGFKSRYEGKIGIGNTMTDVMNAFGDYFEDNDMYSIKGVENLSFELGDTDDESDWSELDAPIEWLWIYDINIKIGSTTIKF